jgi:hypothetical protein
MACVLQAYVELDLFGRCQNIMSGQLTWQNRVLSAVKRQRFVAIDVVTNFVLIMLSNALHVGL